MTPHDYTKAANQALEKTRDWYAEHPDIKVPDDVLDTPKGCPLWSFGLSLFQAGWVHSAIKKERST